MKKVPSIGQFFAFFRPTKKDSWYSFDPRNPKSSCISKMSSSTRDKNWKEKFFYIDARIIQGKMIFRAFGEEVLDILPTDVTLDSSLYRYLRENPTDLQPLSEHSMVALGMSRWWDRVNMRPSYCHKQDGEYFISFSFSFSYANLVCLFQNHFTTSPFFFEDLCD
jgi:hypothetical protein